MEIDALSYLRTFGSHNIQILFISKYNRSSPGGIREPRSIPGTYESLIFSSAFDLAIYSVFIAQFECPIFAIFVSLGYFSLHPIEVSSPRSGCELLSLSYFIPYVLRLKMYSSSFIVVFIGTVFYRYP